MTDIDVGIACTAPERDGKPGVREIERLYLDMIAAARRYIYAENQYFTSDKIGEALARRLAEPDGPEIVLVSRLLSHGWLEEVTMTALRNRLLIKLRDADAHRRFHAYYPDIPGLAEGTCIDIHSKVMVVDDEWLRIGSANLCNRSMGMDSECDVVVEARGEERVARAVHGFLCRLLGEHLGVEPGRVQRAIDERGSIRGAIEALGSETRTLRRLEAKADVSEAALTAAAIADPEAPVTLDRLSSYFAPSAAAGGSGPAWGKFVLAAIVLAGLALAWRFTPLADVVTAANVTAWAREFGDRWWAPLAVVAAPTLASLIMFPRPLITLAAVLVFGAWLGFVYAMTGIMVAALATFFAGRLVRRDTVRRLAGRKLDRLSAALRQRGLLAMTAVRLVPLAPFPVVGLVAGRDPREAMALRARYLSRQPARRARGNRLRRPDRGGARRLGQDQLVGGWSRDRRPRRRHGGGAEMARERRRRKPTEHQAAQRTGHSEPRSRRFRQVSPPMRRSDPRSSCVNGSNNFPANSSSNPTPESWTVTTA